MLKLIEIPKIKPESERTQAAPIEDANNVFRVMHGFYGNLFLSKFATGEVLANGGDGGVASARTIWAHGLRSFDVETVKTALARTMDTHPEYPPTLPQFVALCKACAPGRVYQHPAPSIAMGAELRAQRTKAARDAALKAVSPAPEKQTPAVGLQVLNQLIAQAVGLAGGDEAKTLIRFDREFSGLTA
jgi:hypothetical protein